MVLIDVVERYTHPWPKNDPKYYYVEFWKKKFAEDISVYQCSNELNPMGLEIKVYYDTDGELHVINCSDRDLECRIRNYMDNWYRFIVDKEYEEPVGSLSIAILIEPYVRPLKEGFYQIRYRGIVCNLSDSQLYDVKDLTGWIRRKEGRKVVVVDSGIPRFDRIIQSMYSHDDIWPIKGHSPDFAPGFLESKD